MYLQDLSPHGNSTPCKESTSQKPAIGTQGWAGIPEKSCRSPPMISFNGSTSAEGNLQHRTYSVRRIVLNVLME